MLPKAQLNKILVIFVREYNRFIRIKILLRYFEKLKSEIKLIINYVLGNKNNFELNA